MWLIISKYRYALSWLLLVVGLVLVWFSGYATAKFKYEAQISSLKAEYAQKQLATEQAYSAQLSSSLKKYEQWAARAEQINQAQIAQTRAAQQSADELKRKIDDVIQQDKLSGNDCTGIGINSLRHYNQSLGY